MAELIEANCKEQRTILKEREKVFAQREAAFDEEVDTRLKEAVKDYERNCRIEMGNYRYAQEQYYNRRFKEKMEELEKKALIKNASTVVFYIAISISLFFSLKHLFQVIFMR